MLDSKRLGNQRVEARMILRWLRNPAQYPRQQAAGYTIMWKGHEEALCLYYNACCEEWARRGGKNIVCQPEPTRAAEEVALPPWLGDDRMHVTHRSALLHKLPAHYEKFGWAREIPDPKVEYLWPRPRKGDESNYQLCPPAFWKKSSPAKNHHARKKPGKKWDRQKQRAKRSTREIKRKKPEKKRNLQTQKAQQPTREIKLGQEKQLGQRHACQLRRSPRLAKR